MKKTKVFGYLLAIPIVCIALNTLAQKTSSQLTNQLPLITTTVVPNTEANEIRWKHDATVSHVDFYHAIIDCNNQKVVLLRFENHNSFQVRVNWKDVIKTQMRTEEKPQELTIAPGKTLAQNCADNVCKSCIISPDKVSPTYAVKIMDYSFKEISISK